ncbi:MAG: GNAT family N-acetyltransferase [Scytonematopsis contorta HA4267-MV1]|nr:GNAT family N-acetyltransferase [Scytonematopsis contorta HA4267-MV1]
MPTIQTLKPGDEEALEAFLAQHASTSMFLRSNLRAVGLLDNGERFQGTYVAAIEDEKIIAVAAHYWNGMVIPQAPVYLKEVVQAAVLQSGRMISGITGAGKQVEAATDILGLRDKQISLDEREVLFSLTLCDLKVPDALTTGEVICRLPLPVELELLGNWCAAYTVEALGKADTPKLLHECRRTVENRQLDKAHFCLVKEQQPLAYCTFNAQLPDVVQIGGVWTPPNLRGNGYAKSVVAGALLHARSVGVKQAILFTQRNNIAAQSVYRAIGFEATGEEYGLLLLQNPVAS